MSIEPGVLYVVATPIGNLEDLSPRAARCLREVALIAAEDTRHSGPMLRRIGVETPLLSLHEYNEERRTGALLERLAGGESIALISDAGTPLISDPGFPLVRECRRRGVRVSPIPGPSALVAALSASGMPCDRFRFEGFPPHKSMARQGLFEGLRDAPETLVFYESSHRIQETVSDMASVFGGGRLATLARELTKLHETFLQDTLEALAARLAEDADQRRGEFVVIVAGKVRDESEIPAEAAAVLAVLLEELPVRQASALASRITGVKKNLLYRLALESQGEG